ncbi:MAG: hypothetical protein HFF68_09505 [Oscillospiraceae bacterium]|jgi:hypothetical protein|nr:hypothetical protein [Oscillospiraceae bacterium]MCI8715870.1 hypothetical protein [Oscillospiraceae bacterium]MCI9317475.1 hypothetical protein [Oscillospiraceae bacterium]MDE6935071.1 hypothetical protein [Oscillospiraceae bacterium]
MRESVIRRLSNLLSVKSLVTLTLTAVFAYMAAAGTISKDFMTIYAVIIAFYFGTQSRRDKGAGEGGSHGDGS